MEKEVRERKNSPVDSASLLAFTRSVFSSIAEGRPGARLCSVLFPRLAVSWLSASPGFGNKGL